MAPIYQGVGIHICAFGNMVKKRKHAWRKNLPCPLPVRAEIYGLLGKMGGNRSKSLLSALWRDWKHILGEDLAHMAIPLGAQKNTLILGAEDAIQMQEIHFLCSDILQKVNAFLKTEYFHETRINLVSQQEKIADCAHPANLDQNLEGAETAFIHPPQESKATGIFLHKMNLSSPVARCYAKFAKKT